MSGCHEGDAYSVVRHINVLYVVVSVCLSCPHFVFAIVRIVLSLRSVSVGSSVIPRIFSCFVLGIVAVY